MIRDERREKSEDRVKEIDGCKGDTIVRLRNEDR